MASVPTGADSVHITFEFRAPRDDVLKNPALTITELYDWNAQNNPNYPIFVFHDGHKRQYITYSSANEAINRAARYVCSSVGSPGDTLGQPRRLVAVLANTDTITYFCTVVGALRAGFAVFLISTRNAPAAVVDILQRTRATHIFVSPDVPMQSIAKTALAAVAESGIHISQHAMPVFEDLYPKTADLGGPFEAKVVFPSSYDMTEPALVLHSSGSSGHPKPVGWSHRHLTAWGLEAVGCDVDLTGAVQGCHGIPMFHGMGAFMYAASPMCGFIVAAFKPVSPPAIPTPEAVWNGMVATGVNVAVSVPSFIEWARDPEKVQEMRKMKGVLVGGAPLNEEVGNALAAENVPLFSVYGATEAGLISTLMRDGPSIDWQYWALSPNLKCAFRPMGEGTFEFIVISSPERPLPKVNTKEGEFDAFATNDLVAPHPTVPGLWKIIGRADEQIILSNGEKTNPIPLERIINGDPHVNSSIMFGHGRFQNGVLVEPSKQFVIDSTNTQQLAAFRNMIWPSIEQANNFSPQHSWIFKEMILIVHPSKPFRFNAKGLPCRGLLLNEYEAEIDALYKEVESSTQSDVLPPISWDADNTLKYVRAVAESTLRCSIPDDADIFRNGGDSLQATWIRNVILSALRKAHPSEAQSLPMNLVFAFPTISSLANIITSTLTGVPGPPSNHSPRDLWEYVERYSATFPPRPTPLVTRPREERDVVLITGTTGGLGCDALEHLLADGAVARVYAFNRPNAEKTIAERQRAQFRARGLDEGLLDAGKLVLVEAVFHEPGFGINCGLLEEIRGSVTHIILNAWKVDFNMSITSFEVDMQASRNFIDLALSSSYDFPPAIIFVSSIGVFTNYKHNPPVPESSLDDPESPLGSGYSESKWVTEQVLGNVARTSGLHTVIVRLGQVAGDRRGYWNEREWFPALVKTAIYQRCLPDLEGDVSWVPAHEAAKVLTEMRHSSDPFLHLVHPHPVSWRTLLAPIAEHLDVPLVPYGEWLAALERGAATGSADEVAAMEINPALRLLSFFQFQKDGMQSGREPMGLVRLSVEKATRVSATLSTLPQLDTVRAIGWLAAWRAAGFL